MSSTGRSLTITKVWAISSFRFLLAPALLPLPSLPSRRLVGVAGALAAPVLKAG